MKKRKYSLSQQCMAYVLLIGLFLQSCNGFSNPLIPTEEEQSQMVRMEKNSQRLVAHGGHQISITEQADTLQATVEENLPVGFSKTHYNVPVYVAPDVEIRNLSGLGEKEQKRLVEVNLPSHQRQGYVYVGSRGLVGGMKKAEYGSSSIDEGNFSNLAQIGQGSFGVVYKGIWKRNLAESIAVAIKTLKEIDNTEELSKEKSIMENIIHKNIVKYFGIHDIKINNVLTKAIVTELMNEGSVLNFLKKGSKQTIKPLDILSFAIDAATGMRYLHENDIIHRDLAARNLLLNKEQGRLLVKVSDFGLSRKLPAEYEREYGHYSVVSSTNPTKWSAPEYFVKKQVSTRSDLWSFGVVLYELFTFCQEPYEDWNNQAVIKRIKAGEEMYKYLQIPDCPEGIQELVNGCMSNDSGKRPGFSTIIYKLNKAKNKAQESNTWKISDEVSLGGSEGIQEEIKDSPYGEKENSEFSKDEEGGSDPSKVEKEDIEQAANKLNINAENKLGNIPKETENDQKKDHQASLQLIKTQMADKYDTVRRHASEALIEIVKEAPELSKEALQLIPTLMADKNSLVQVNARAVLQVIVKKAPEFSKEVLLVTQTLMTDKNSLVQINARAVLEAIVKEAPEFSKEVLLVTQTLMADKDIAVRFHASRALGEIVKVAPELSKEAFQVIQILGADKDGNVRMSASEALQAIVKVAPELRKEALQVIQSLTADKFGSVRWKASEALIEIVKVAPELRKEALQIIRTPVADKDDAVRRNASEALKEIVQVAPELRKEALQVIQALVADKDFLVRSNASLALKEIVKVAPELRKEALQLVKTLTGDRDALVRRTASQALKTVVQVAPELRKEALLLIKTLMADKDVRWHASYVLEEIVKEVPEISKEALLVIQSLVADKDKDVRINASLALQEIVKVASELSKEAFLVIQALVADKDDSVRCSASNALREIVKVAPELRKEAFPLVKTLMADKYDGVRRNARLALKELEKNN